ncbi:MAG: pyridoxamine 5'-phosphate oxidase family protein [Chloroflexota bacterium]
MPAPPRSAQQRKQDTLHRLQQDVDLWVATADPSGGSPYLIPLSYLWDGTTLLVATPAASVTGRNLQATRVVRLGLGPTRDVVLVEGAVETLTPAELPPGVGDAFAQRTGFDPRQESSPYLYFRITPRRIQAWREANELAGRDLMRDGRWLVPE